MTNNSKKWKLLPGHQGSGSKDLPKWFLDILANRNLKSEQQISSYLEPDYEDLYKPDSFLNMKKAVERIAVAKDNNEKVVVYGDYDVDGITSTALVKELLDKIGVQKTETYIPHREEEGYGLHEAAIEEIIKSGAGLIISVDCGISSRELIDEYAERVDFLVCDHHEAVADKMPKGAIILHPEMVAGNTEPQKLSACGMAFFLAKGCAEKFPEVMPNGCEKWFLDLVALSTICDVVPLTGQNRILAKYGLVVIGKTKRIGLAELCEVSGVKPKEVNAYSVGFLLGPRLNAAGRLEHAKLALELLLSTDKKRAREIAENLSRLNAQRQKMCERILEEAKAEIEKSGRKEDEIYLLSNKNWPRGVVGIIAGRLAESYARPVIVFENDGETHHGSARSVGEFDITAALAECEDCLERFGGHAKAAGLTVAADKFVILRDKLLEITKNKIKIEDLQPEIKIDTVVKVPEINNEMLTLLSKMEPFGFGNVTPVFEIENAAVESIKKVGDAGQHLKLIINYQLPPRLRSRPTAITKLNSDDKKSQKLEASGQQLSAIWFGGGETDAGASLLSESSKQCYDILFQPRYNDWNNRRSIELRVLDLKKTK